MIEKLHATGVQNQMIAEMQRMQAQAAAGAIDPASGDHRISAGAPSFGQVLDNAVSHVDGLQHSASDRQRAIEMGTSDDLTGTMLESQKASIAFSALMQVRNKLTHAFDEVMNISM
ncbi:flagellar hook-basal body complex protein FliE [Pantoea sp. B65]|uniref:flagellar hook-basal body complex protein FliE n=1 Tax=Pantoea sp. B65 TaxID=2813359 RepID=UPI0039B44A14